jgi:hypothetical protein
MPAPVSPAIGAFIDKSVWDGEIYDRNMDLQAAWVNWTPTWTAVTSNPVLGNGSLVAAYKQIGYGGATVHVRMRLRAGTTTAFGSGLWSFTLPSGLVPIAVQTLHGFAGNADGTDRHTVAAYITTGGLMDRISSAGGTGLSSSSPFVWATNYQLIIGGTYQIA